MMQAPGQRLAAPADDGCARVRDAVAEGSELSPELRTHVESCETCGALAADGGALGRRLAELGEEMPALAELRAGVNAAVAADASPVGRIRSLATPVRVGLAAMAVAAIVLGTLSRSPRVDLTVYPQGRMLVVVGLYAIVLGVALRHALRPLQMKAPDPRRATMPLAALVAVPIALALAPVAHVEHPASLIGRDADFLARAGLCFVTGIALAVPLLLLLWLLDRREHRNPLAAALAAFAAGVAASFALDLHCAITYPLHLLASHASIGLVVAAVYLPLRRRLSEPKNA